MFIAGRTRFWQIRIYGSVPVNFSFSYSVLWFLVFHRKRDMALNLEQVLLSLTFLHVSANPHMETTSVESLLCSHSSSRDSQDPWDFDREMVSAKRSQSVP